MTYTPSFPPHLQRQVAPLLLLGLLLLGLLLLVLGLLLLVPPSVSQYHVQVNLDVQLY
jgi:hypothetical protein